MEVLYKLIVDDRPGVLDRIAGLVRRHAKNISFLMVYASSEKGKSILFFKLEGGIEDAAISKRIRENADVHSLEIIEDKITEKISQIGG